MSPALMALQDDWLNGTATTAVATTMTVGSTLTYDPWWAQRFECHYPYLTYPTIQISSPSRPIKLTVREVERLRDAAQKDPDLRHILEKFTAHIEVTVSFEP